MTHYEKVANNLIRLATDRGFVGGELFAMESFAFIVPDDLEGDELKCAFLLEELITALVNEDPKTSLRALLQAKTALDSAHIGSVTRDAMIDAQNRVEKLVGLS